MVEKELEYFDILGHIIFVYWLKITNFDRKIGSF